MALGWWPAQVVPALGSQELTQRGLETTSISISLQILRQVSLQLYPSPPCSNAHRTAVAHTLSFWILALLTQETFCPSEKMPGSNETTNLHLIFQGKLWNSIFSCRFSLELIHWVWIFLAIRSQEPQSAPPCAMEQIFHAAREQHSLLKNILRRQELFESWLRWLHW